MKKQKLIGLAALTIILQGTAFAGVLERSIRLDDSQISHSLTISGKQQSEVVPSLGSSSYKAEKSLVDSYAMATVNFKEAVQPNANKIRSHEDLSKLPNAPVHKLKLEEKQSFGHQVKTFLVSSVDSVVAVAMSFAKKLISFFSR